MQDNDKVNPKVTGVASAYPGDRTKVPAFRTRARHVKLQPIMRVLPRRILTKSHYLANASAQGVCRLTFSELSGRHFLGKVPFFSEVPCPCPSCKRFSSFPYMTQ